jgi:hypothetical protein
MKHCMEEDRDPLQTCLEEEFPRLPILVEKEIRVKFKNILLSNAIR